MNRTETVVPLQRSTDADHAPDNEIHDRLNKPDRALAYPSGHASNLISGRRRRNFSADEVADQALAHRPVAL